MTMSPRAPICQIDSYRRRMETRVVRYGGGRHPWVVLEDTLFYPEGGGQPSDRGWISGREVVDVQKVQGVVRHYLRAPWDGGVDQVELQLDWRRRFDHMQQHTAQHLLTALAADRFGWQTTSFHLGIEQCDIELDIPHRTRGQVSAPPPRAPGRGQVSARARGRGQVSELELDRQFLELEEMVAEAVRANLRVSVRFVSAAECSELSIRSRGLPKGHRGEIRLVEVEGLDLNTCGGTHVSSTGQLETVKLLGRESIRGGTRLFFLAGRRVRRRLQAHEDRNAELRNLLGAGDEEFVSLVQRYQTAARDAERKIRALQQELATAYGSLLGARQQRVVAEHFVGHDLAFLQILGRSVTEKRPDALLFLTSEKQGNRGVFLLAAGRKCSLDLSALGKQVAETLGGRGGGSGRLFQGKAEKLSRRDEVSRRLDSMEF